MIKSLEESECVDWTRLMAVRWSKHERGCGWGGVRSQPRRSLFQHRSAVAPPCGSLQPCAVPSPVRARSLESAVDPEKWRTIQRAIGDGLHPRSCFNYCIHHSLQSEFSSLAASKGS